MPRLHTLCQNLHRSLRWLILLLVLAVSLTSSHPWTLSVRQVDGTWREYP